MEKVPYAIIYKVMGGSHRPHFVGEQIEDINSRILDFFKSLTWKMLPVIYLKISYYDGHIEYAKEAWNHSLCWSEWFW